MTRIHFPLSMIAATLVAFYALYLTSGSWLLLLLAVGLLGTYFVPARLARASSAAWIIRLLAYGSIATLYGSKPGNAADWLFEARAFNVIGLLAAAELVLQAWREPPPGARYHAVIILLSGIVFLAGCNTFDDSFVRYLTPLYIALTILALRALQPRAALDKSAMNKGATHRVPTGYKIHLMRGWLALSLAVTGGAVMHYSVWTYRGELMSWGAQFFRERRLPQSVGMASQPSLGSTFEAQDSPTRVLRIEGALSDDHLRGMTFDTYINGRWEPSFENRNWRDVSLAELHSDMRGPRTRVTRLVGRGGLLFMPLNVAAVIPTEGSEMMRDTTQGRTLRTSDPPPYAYEIILSNQGSELGIPIHQGPLCAPPDAVQHARYLDVPAEIDSRVRALAQRIVRGLDDPTDRIEAVAEYLMAHHSYSRRTRHGPGEPVSTFLLKKKTAHCEYFASAAVILLRCVGVPARYVTGYYAHERAGKNITVVRQHDAHAWAECFVDGVGWITVDATPADGRPDEAAPPVPFWLRAWEWLQDQVSATRDRLANLTRGQLALLMLGVLALWALERWRLSRRQKAPLQTGFTYSAPPADLATLARRFEAWLQQRGLSCPDNCTWQEHLEEKLSVVDSTAAKVFLKEYYAVRFGRPEDQRAVTQLSAMLESLEKQEFVPREHMEKNQ